METITKRRSPCYECSIHKAKLNKSQVDKCKNCKDRIEYALSTSSNLFTNSDYNFTDAHNIRT